MFTVGQKVVCVADYSEFEATEWAQALGTDFPRTGEVYTVRRVVHRVQAGESGYGIMLAEVLNMEHALDKKGVGGMETPPDDTFVDEIAFNSVDFRPLITVEDFVDTSANAPVDAGGGVSV